LVIEVSQPSEIVEVTVTSMDTLGRGVGQLPDGTIVVVSNARIGETVKAKVKFKTIIQGRRLVVAERV